MKKVMLISVVAVIISVFSLSHSAYAHFIVEDAHTGVKASFHVTPDHDPIAGKESVISFDFAKTELQPKDYSYILTVKSTRDEGGTVPVELVGNVLIAEYTFPSQGFYTITLTATHKDDYVVSKLQYGQRVSRGVIVEKEHSFNPLETGVIVGVILISIGAVIFSLVSNHNELRKKRNETKSHK